jgi:hypothetical protein
MRPRILGFCLIVLMLNLAAQLNAAEVWVVRAIAFGQPLEQGCGVIWADRLTFFNDSDHEATVRLVSVSNGELRGTPVPLPLSAGRTREIRNDFPFGGDLEWHPSISNTLVPLAVVKLDVPEGVLVSDRIEVREACPAAIPLGFSTRSVRGSILMEPRRSLVPAGRRQVHLGTDIGLRFTGETFVTIANRINVGVYNGGTASTTAEIELQRSCDSGVIDRRVVTLPPNTIQQFGGFSNPGTPVTGCNTSAPYDAYVIVTMDQPGFSYALALSNEVVPYVPLGIGSGR